MMFAAWFPSPTVALYLARTFLVRSAVVLAGLVLILQTLDLLGESGRILAYPGNGDREVWRYVSLRTPQIIANFLPFSVLLGTIIALSQLNANSEVIAMKSGGLSAHQVLAPLILAAFGVALLSFAFNDRIVSRASATLDQWKKISYAPLPMDRGDRVNVWVRDGDDLLSVRKVSGRGNAAQLRDVTLYDRDNGTLMAIIRAPRGTHAGGGWRIGPAQRFDVTTGVVTHLGTITISRGVRPDQFTLSRVNADGLSLRALSRAIDDLRDAGRPTKSLEGSLWHKLAGPLSSVLMPLLGAVAAFGLARSGKLFIRAVLGMLLGFLYFMADNFALALGNLGVYPPLLAAWAPFFLFLLIGEVVLVRTEE